MVKFGSRSWPDISLSIFRTYDVIGETSLSHPFLISHAQFNTHIYIYIYVI